MAYPDPRYGLANQLGYASDRYLYEQQKEEYLRQKIIRLESENALLRTQNVGQAQEIKTEEKPKELNKKLLLIIRSK